MASRVTSIVGLYWSSSNRNRYLFPLSTSHSIQVELTNLPACLAISATIGPSISNWQRIWNQAIEVRLDITTKMLGQMKEVKLLGLTEQIEAIIRTLRSDEIRKSAKYRKFLVAILIACKIDSRIIPGWCLADDLCSSNDVCSCTRCYLCIIFCSCRYQ